MLCTEVSFRSFEMIMLESVSVVLRSEIHSRSETNVPLMEEFPRLKQTFR